MEQGAAGEDGAPGDWRAPVAPGAGSACSQNLESVQAHAPAPQAIRPAKPDDRPRGHQSSGYKASGAGLRSLVLVAAIHAAAIAGLLGMTVAGSPDNLPAPLAAFDITLPPTPSPAPAPPPPEPAKAAPPPAAPVVTHVAAPPRNVVAPQPGPALAPRMASPSTNAVGSDRAVAAPQASAPVPVTPVPVSAPDFAAAQLGNAGPRYPYLSRKAREEGVVLLRVLVTPQGRAARLEVETSSGFDRLDKAALDTVRKWRFLAARQGDKPVEAWVLVPVTFALNG
ncbi:energy transducer TonB [Croceicoccus sp. F390]|uniref:Energy transducer TonB n=1 Tax=Croceicoccus esteveae TaxID=3075597 RepID=A0ABU2ZH36_9SPHN|nr:energy transducer TonB [Croceicoccus sp. F390]MDT0574727.1 energy transducer TonB [Croceicoccus sp. F390]